MYKLVRSGLKAIDAPQNACGRNWTLDIKVEVDEEGIDPNILVFQRNVYHDDAGDPFVDVADVHDLNFLPIGKCWDMEDEHPVEDHVPYYRLDHVTFDCYTADEAEEIWGKITGRVRKLVKEYNAARDLEEKEVFHA